MSDSPNQEAGLSVDQHEALQEIVNIGMGKAGDSLARILKTFVELSIPRIKLVDLDSLNHDVMQLIGEKAIVTSVRQAFFSYWRGEAIVIYDQNGCNELASLMGYDSELDKQNEVELLLDVGNVLVGACINGIAEQLDVKLNFSPPSVISSNSPIDRLFTPEKMTWSHSLLLEVNFGLEDHLFKSHLLIMMSEETIQTLKQDIDTFLEGL